eukprot:4339500-Pyramimonas_sp.AAC.1
MLFPAAEGERRSSVFVGRRRHTNDDRKLGCVDVRGRLVAGGVIVARASRRTAQNRLPLTFFLTVTSLASSPAIITLIFRLAAPVVTLM